MKRIISVLISLFIILSFVPTVFAASDICLEIIYDNQGCIISGSGVPSGSDLLLKLNNKDGVLVYYNADAADSDGCFTFKIGNAKDLRSCSYSLICSEVNLKKAGMLSSLPERENITFGNPVSYGSVLTATNCVRIATSTKNGIPIGVTVVPGSPTYFNVVNLNTMELIEEHIVPNASSTAHMIETAGNGDIYFGTYTKARLYRYSPEKGCLEDLGRVFSEGAVVSMAFGEDCVYLGTFPSALIVKYTISTGTFEKVADVSNTEQYTSGLSYYDGKLYYQTMNNNEGLYVLDEKTGETKVIPFPENSISGAERLYIRGKYLVLHSTRLVLYDLEKKAWYSKIYGTNVQGNYATPVLNNCIYYADGGYFYRLNLSTGTSVKLGMTFGSYMRGGGFAEIDNTEISGTCYVNIGYTGSIQLWNFSKLKSKSFSGMLSKAASETRDFQFGPDGRLYVGEYMGTKAAVFEPKSGRTEYIHMSQPEGIAVVGNKIYFGTYTNAILYILDTTKKYYPSYDKKDPECNPRIWGETGEGQDRPFVMIEAEGKLIQGSIPGYGELGGAISIYDPETDEMEGYRNFCPNQSPVSLAYNEGKLYIGTSVSGGLGVYPSETQAKVVVFDLKTRRVIASKDMIIPGNSNPVKGVEGLAFAPDDTLVGYGRGYMFKMNPETLEITNSKIYGNINYGDGMQVWKPKNMIYDESTDRYFISIDGRLALLDYRTLSYKLTDSVLPENAKIGPEGDLWYIGSGYSVTRLPVFRGDENVRVGAFPCTEDGEKLSVEKLKNSKEIKVRLARKTGFEKEIKVVAAFYDENNRLVTASMVNTSENEAVFKFEKSIADAKKMKIFLWNAEGMKPYDSSYEFEIK